MYTNFNQYFEYIENKFQQSERNYKIVFTEEQTPETFLMTYESMNVYPTFPRPIVLPLKKSSDKEFVDEISFDRTQIEKVHSDVNDKIKEYSQQIKKIQEISGTKKIRRYFDYELRDIIHNKYGISHVTNGWIKMYEILNTYSFFDKNNSEIQTFHICEHPGKFIFATKDFISKNKITNKHHYVYQSLNPATSSGFKLDPKLKSDPNGKLDYGIKKTGDISDPDNIDYYIKQYQNQNFTLFTSDCGEDFSEDFTKQEGGMYEIYLGALITVVGIAPQKSNYVFKFFSFADDKTIELLYIMTKLYETVDIVRLMTTKSNSGENYCVCRNFNYKPENKSQFVKKLISYLIDLRNKNNSKVLFASYDPIFIDRINKYYHLLALRRMTAMNQLLFRLANNTYTKNNESVINLVKQYVDYYTTYFLNYIGLKH